MRRFWVTIIMEIQAIVILLIVFQFGWHAGYANPQKLLLTRFVLESGDTLQQVQVSYSSYGRLNADSSNVVLVCTWFTGTSPEVGKLWTTDAAFLDTNRFAILVVDAPGNGLSVSPSNSNGHFPNISIADMVHMQYRLLTEHIGLRSVYAIAGISMGGMQAWQWAAQYPAFFKKMIAISATPAQTTYDKLFWSTTLQLLQLSVQSLPSQRDSLLKAVAMLQELHLYTPAYRNKETPASDAKEWMANRIAFAEAADPRNWICQIKAMLQHDVFRYRSAEQWKSGKNPQMLIIVPQNDIMVNPDNSIKIAQLMKIKPLILRDNCGHQSSVSCGKVAIKNAIHEFLNIENEKSGIN